ncbi:MAG: hypothetical protein ACQ9MH_14445 [Nitrospinales bacterium]
MSEKPKTTAPKTKENTQVEEPGLTDSYGSFPVWMLKIINALTPEILQEPSKPVKKPSEDPKE